MSVQYIEISGQRLAVLPVSDYEKLAATVRDASSKLIDAHKIVDENCSGSQAVLPADYQIMINEGASPLRAWRKFRGLSQAELGQKVGRGAACISKLEKQQSEGGVMLWRALSDALQVSIDQIYPGSR